MQRVKSISSSRQTHLPAIEWSSMRHLLGDAALAQLVGTSEASLLRFAQGQRATPGLSARGCTGLRWSRTISQGRITRPAFVDGSSGRVSS
jgi:hypothetical protein